MLKTKHGAPMLELKAIEEDGKFAGYGSIFGNKDSHGDVVMRGAFGKSLADHASRGSRPKMFWQHDMGKPIGKWVNYVEDEKGLYMEGQLNMGVQQGREAHALLKAGDIDGLSIGYRVVDAENDRAAKVVRLKEVQLMEVSIVSLGSNDRALIDEVKTWGEGETPTTREFEKFLRDVGGFSKTLAAAIASGATPHLRGEPEGKADELAEFLMAIRA